MTASEDPRLTGEYVVHVSDEGGHDVVLVGVVHDHPASTYRVKAVVEEKNPDVLALELPPLAVPLFEEYADDSRTPPAMGGEMSAAVQTAETDRVVGVDGPTSTFVARLGWSLYRTGTSRETVRKALRSLASVTRHAVVCRLAAVPAARAGVRVEVDRPVRHDCDWHDEPDRQAADERDQVRQAKSVANAFQRPTAVRVREETREEYMADQLASLRSEGSVLAVVGIDHLDPIRERLEPGGPRP